MNNLYHFVANVGIIMSGCSRIYFNNPGLKGTKPVVIRDPEFFLKNILNLSYRLSKSSIKTCIAKNYKEVGLRNLLAARALLNISINFRKEIKNICIKLYKNWVKPNIDKHTTFEIELQSIIDEIDIFIEKIKHEEQLEQIQKTRTPKLIRKSFQIQRLNSKE